MVALLARIMYFLDFHDLLEDTVIWQILNVMYNFIFQESYAFTPIVPHKLYLGDYQWMMIGALPFMLLYNYKRGYRLKCFFYFFYPIHIILLALLSHIYY